MQKLKAVAERLTLRGTDPRRPNRDRVGLRQPRCLPDDGPDVGGGVRTELEANLNAAGALERYHYWSDKLEHCFSNNAPEASHDRRQPQSPSGYRQSSERARASVC